ncbi:MAG TPA: hypothetical protein VMX55_06375 [candidate division Zixibacteria bacterium]|nr:hypothetical protein [candidate division Zixibacteria bacterium]
MKPECLSISIFGKNGVVPLRAYPENIPKKILDKIAIVGLPHGSMEGNFILGNVDKFTFASYVFLIPSENLTYLASLIAIYKKTVLNSEYTKHHLIEMIDKTRQMNLDTLEDILNNLPEIYKEYKKGSFTFKTSTTVTLSIESIDKRKKQKGNEIETFGNDIWEEESWKDESDEKMEERKKQMSDNSSEINDKKSKKVKKKKN